MNDLYQEIILEEYAHPQNKGVLKDADAQHSESNSSCGDQVTVYLKWDSQTSLITDTRWEGVGCAISMATASFLSEHLKGMPAADVSALQQADIEKLLGIKDISPGRQKCLMLALVAYQKALQNIES